MQPFLEQTVLRVKDLAEQPPSKYVAIVAVPGSAAAVRIAVDDAIRDEHGALLVLPDQTRVALHRDVSFMVLPRELVEFVTQRDFCRAVKDDAIAVAALARDLYPEEAAAAEKQRQRMLQSLGVDDRPAPGFCL